jgi:hypothetical protein
MADFVAVIRRAVDGLANNTPEMRVKVYDKARGAVQRQLENMKPRPPEDMLRRQMEKLEAAIVSVESEHAEALEPATEDAAAAAVAAPLAARDPFDDTPSAYAEPAQEEAPQAPPALDSAPAEEPVEPSQEPTPVYHEQAPVFREDDYEEPAPAAAQSEPAVYPDEAVAPEEPVVPQPYEEPQRYEEVQASAHPATDETPTQQYGDWRDDLPPEDEVPAAPEPHLDDRQAEPASPASEPSYTEAPDHFAAEEQRAVEQEDAPYQYAETTPEPPAEAENPWAEPQEQPSQPVADPWLEPAQAEAHSGQPDGELAYSPAAEQQPEPPQEVAAPWDVDASELPVTAPAATAPAVDDWGWEAPAPAPTPAATQQADVTAAWDDVPELLSAGPTEPVHHGAHASAVDAHFDPEMHVQAETVRMPPVTDFPELAHTTPAAVAGVAGATAMAATAPAATAPASNDDPFADFFDPQPKTETTQLQAETKPKAADSNDPWGDLEDLIGFSKDQPEHGGTSRGTLHSDVDADDLLTSPAKPYRVTPVRKRNYAGILLGVVGLLLVAGGGYAIWMNRDSLNDMVDGLIQSGSSATQTAQQTAPAPATPASPTPAAPEASAPANQTAAAPAAPAQPAASSNTNAAAPVTPGAADGSVAGDKFTQRLMADGSEMDAGPGGAGGLAQNAEGQSVAQLNAPPAQPAPASPPSTPAAPAGAAAPAATPAEAPALAGEKMFLYEERIGQTAPTAIEGAVSWSLQREPGANGRQEPVVQGRLNIPERGLTALLTFKRNADPSLPASHLIEIVFAVPPDFEGGAIESVQRIAMKSTEQDRGNALIAVPAKITDDFHMIALNDFPDARNTNLELLRTRNWIDIPLAYRNGRRALLTLQKGADGERIFNDAIREWSAMAPTSGQ